MPAYPACLLDPCLMMYFTQTKSLQKKYCVNNCVKRPNFNGQQNEPISIVFIRPNISYLFLWPNPNIRGKLVFNIWYVICHYCYYFNFYGGFMNHTIKFKTIHDMLAWIVENKLYDALPVDLTIHLGETK